MSADWWQLQQQLEQQDAEIDEINYELERLSHEQERAD